MKVGAYLDDWLNIVKANSAHNTWLSYHQQVNKHVKPRIGNLTLRSLRPIKVQQFISTMQAEGVPSATCSYVVRVLHQALARAVKLQLIPSAPTLFVDRPKHRPKDIDPFDEAEMQKILDEAATSPYRAVYELAFQCGPRQGEIFGALWDDFDLMRKVWFVKRQLIYSSGKHETNTPKTLKSVRKLELTDRVIEALHERRRIAMREGVAASPYVFCSQRGNPLWPGDFWVQHWKPMLRRLRIRHRGIHHCRHSFATMALGAGVPINVVSFILGHANVATTLKYYAHCLPSQQQQSTAALAKIIG